MGTHRRASRPVFALAMPARKQTRAFTARAVARVALCALVVVASFANPIVAQDDADASDAPPGPARVLVRKRIVEDLIVEGSNVTVAVTLTNAGRRRRKGEGARRRVRERGRLRVDHGQGVSERDV